ncbi:isoprenoid synthase domain-containing protein [Pisolithus marmoratus]|nr:isoprenoid synthase domain-containing protein [Pisolithus marmoratus]
MIPMNESKAASPNPIEGQPLHTICIQLPDLLTACSPFELWTNGRCKVVSQASERWLLDCGVVLPSMKWRPAKVGLLAAACYPTADAPRLRLMADVLGLLVYRLDRPALGTSTDHNGAEGECADIARMEQEIFSLLSDRLSSAAYRSPGWYIRFRKAQCAFLDARCQTPAFEAGNLESYISFRRQQCSFLIPLEMIAYAKDPRLPESFLSSERLEILRDCVCDIAALSEDIVSCANGTPIDPLNVLSIIESGSLEDALAIAGNIVNQCINAFLDVERALLQGLTMDTEKENEGIRRYVQGLRDWVAGFVNWLYETERYFGEKGSEVRAFGWIFVPVN